MENHKKNQTEANDMPSASEIKKSLIYICAFTLAGLAASFIFNWSLWWCLGIGAFIGWALPGFLEGAREELSTPKDDDNEQKQAD